MKNINPITSILDNEDTQKSFNDAIVEHMEHEIQSLGALKGLFIKKTYAAIKAIRPGYVRHIIAVLSRDYIHEFAQMHEDFRTAQQLPAESVQPFIDYVRAHQKEADEHFWHIADEYAKKRSDSMIGKAYKAGRSTIESNLPLIFKIICSEIDHHTVVEG